jgi:hypothetical protein
MSTDIKENTDRSLEGGAKENTTIERRRPPAWDPPILLLVVGQLVEVTTLEVVVAIVGGGSCLRGSIIWSRQTDMGRKRKQSNREYSSEVLSKQGSTLHMQHYQRRAVYVDWAAKMPK